MPSETLSVNAGCELRRTGIAWPKSNTNCHGGMLCNDNKKVYVINDTLIIM